MCGQGAQLLRMQKEQESNGLRYEWLFLMPRSSKPRAGNSFERSELEFDADSPWPHTNNSLHAVHSKNTPQIDFSATIK